MKRAEEPVDINGDIHLVTAREKLDAAERRRGEQRSIAAFYVICALIAAFAAGVWVDRWFQ